MANDCFQFKRFTLHQELCAMKVGTDGTLLGAWARVPCTSDGARILDIGTGSGLIALMMAQRYADACVTGIDIDEDAVKQACVNVRMSPFANRITIVREDVNAHEGVYDAIVSNPPFFVNALPSPDGQRSLARHAITLSYGQLMASARRLLADDGEMSVIVPSEQRSLMESEACIQGFFIVRRWWLKTTDAKPPRRCLLAFARHSQALEEGTFVIGDEQYRALTKDFYL